MSEEPDLLAQRFEADRLHLRSVAYRMLGSLPEAEDAVQESWIRLNRADTSAVENLSGWLTTVVARVCLDMLRSRTSRREDAFTTPDAEPIVRRDEGTDPEQEAVVADSVGLALLVVLETLPPAERLAFVLHDMFGVPFDEIAPIVDRSPEAARQLASRARRRVQGPPAVAPDLVRQRRVVDAFMAASRDGDFSALLAVLDPDVLLRADATAVPTGVALEARGARAVAGRAIAGRTDFAEAALVNGAVGVIVAPAGRLARALTFEIEGDRIVVLEVIADPDRLAALEVAVLEG